MVCFFADRNPLAANDPNGQFKEMTTPEGRSYRYGYDEAGRLDAVNLGPDGLVDLEDYLWDRPRSIRYGLNTPAASETQTLDGLLRRQQTDYSAAQSGNDFSLTYGYNNENHIETITGNPQGDLTYGYDEADRLISAARTNQQNQSADQNESFSYDDAYNRLAANDSQYSYSTAHNGLLDSITTQNSTTTFIHDANGHRTAQTGTENWTYEYNAQERLSRITKNNIEQATYQYNAQGQRIQKTTNTGTTFYLYNNMGLAAEYDQTGTLQKEYGYLPGQPYMTNPVFQRTSTSFAYYQNDHLGTPQRLVDKQGITVWQASYDAFGKASISINTVENNLRFAGQYYDSESGLHQNWFRDYDPKTGRYIERDPIGLRGGVNTYAYVMGNPVSLVDLKGLKPVEDYLSEWICGSQGWDDAFRKAEKQKRGPFDPNDPNDNHNRTAAEHYIFGQAMGNGNLGSVMQAIYVGLGGYSAPVWQGIKFIGLSPNSSPPSMTQAYWESAAYTDFLGLTNYFSGKPGRCSCDAGSKQ